MVRNFVWFSHRSTFTHYISSYYIMNDTISSRTKTNPLFQLLMMSTKMIAETLHQMKYWWTCIDIFICIEIDFYMKNDPIKRDKSLNVVWTWIFHQSIFMSLLWVHAPWCSAASRELDTVYYWEHFIDIVIFHKLL